MRQMATGRRQGFWDLRAAGNFIGGGSGSGLVLASAAMTAGGMEARLPLAVGLALVMLGLSLVWLEIGKPWRALNVFFHPQTSWMTREGILAAPLAAAGAGWVVLGHPALLVPVVVLAAGFLYCQARILRASRGIPAWKQPEIVAFIIATGLAEGSGAALVIGEPSTMLAAVALVAAVGREAAWARYGRALVRDRAPQGTLDCLNAPAARTLRAVQLAALALLAAAVFGLAPAGVAGGALAALSGWGIKALLVTRAAFTRGPRITHTPVRGRGLSRPVEAYTASQ
ncbi:MAG: phenylacetyl-CoA:acceptor oxidoreductase [Magnetospirillum sp.]|nr:MAG: phenylacetyl-CoA:acceptor oxidoreductase [Magnetospirillum sp.]